VSGVLASYRVLETLRETAQAVTYRAVDQASQPVVLEVLRLSPPDPRQLARLDNEHRVAARLQTGAVVHPIATGLFEGRPAIVREPVRGTPLDHLMGAPMEPGRFLAVASAVAAALRDLHACGVIHRDIKPQNLVVDELSGEARITGLGLATFAPREQAPEVSPALIEGTLAYMSPEQTGRMNRAIDQRSDLYSFGVTCYELLTGTLPFSPDDPLEWIHCHIARAPSPPAEVAATPPALSRIVMKLLAKAAEDRYQSAGGLLHDLEECRRQWQVRGRVEAFALGQHDISDRWRLPEGLIGREAEARLLLQTFERMTAGSGASLVLVSGPAGVGKSALVGELQRLVVRSGGRLLSGKFDQQARVPYAPFVQALRALILDVFGESDQGLRLWRQRLAAALGPHAQVLIDLVPQLQLLLGEQPPVAELGPAEAEARLALVCRKFLEAVGGPERPLVLFLDDLQWADLASLRLLQRTVSDAGGSNLVVIGAYRDEEVIGEHPLLRTLQAIRGAGVPLCELSLGPLPPVSVGDLIARALQRRADEVEGLAALVHGKTGGNPFYARQFLDSLHRAGLIAFDGREGRWTWDTPGIAAEAVTINVAAFMATRVSGLSAPARQALQLASCVGVTCPLALLAELLEVDEATVDDRLGEAVAEGLVVRREESVRFSHDRVRQAAYDTLAAPERTALHLRLGRALLQAIPEAALGEAIFDVVHHFHRGAEQIVDSSELHRAAALHLQAGRRAKLSAAHAAAVGYLSDGIALVDRVAPGDGELAFSLERERAECELLSGNLERARALLSALLPRAATPRHKAAVYRIRQALHQLTGEIALAVEDELAGLRACGIELPAHPSMEDVAAERARTDALLVRHPPEKVGDLPRMTDPDWIAATEMVTPSFFTDPSLFFVHVARILALCLEHGLSDNASYWFNNYALALTAFGDYRQARRLAEAANALAERQPMSTRWPEALFVLAVVSFWTDPPEPALDLLRLSYRAGLANGALETPALCTSTLMVMRLGRGDPLPELEQEADAYVAFVDRAGAPQLRDLMIFLRQFIRRLRGRTRGLDTFDDDGFDSARFRAALTPDRLTTATCWCHIFDMRAAFLAGQGPEALAAGERARALLWSSLGLAPQRDFVLYRGLSLAAALDGERRPEWLEELRAHERQARVWSELNPPRFRHLHALLAAELARVEGRAVEALALYDRAAGWAGESGFALEEALAWELAARGHRAQGSNQVAERCLLEARGCYLACDAQAKVRQLDGQLPAKIRAARPFAPRATYQAPAEVLDVLSVVQASQAVSGEVTVERVILRLMELVLAQGGADRGALILPRDQTLMVAAEASLSGRGVEVRDSGAPAAEASLPLSLLHYVSRTGETVGLDDPAHRERFTVDPYFVEQRPPSVLCVPLRRQGVTAGLLYLENRVLSGAFTRPRLQVLELLATQAAISMENAALLEQERTARRDAVEAVRLRDEFLSVASHELNTPLASLTISTQALHDSAHAHREDPQAIVRLADLIDRQAQRLSRLVSDLLDVTRLHEKQLVLSLESLDLAALVRDVVSRSAAQLERAGCVTTLALEPVELRGDRGRLEQVLSNLLSNAMKFGPGRPIAISVSAQATRALLTVADQGIGIDPARQARIFGRFERGVSSTHYGGLGLGLYICRQIVDAHGGLIRVDSPVGEGASFTVELPLAGPPGAREG
jgi:predicted ATPase/signal transduction histidine kinase